MIAVVVAILNAVGAVLPQLPGFLAELQSHPDLSAQGKAALDRLSGRISDDEKAVDAVQPLPEPTG